MAIYFYKGSRGGGKKVNGFVPAYTDKEAERAVERLAVRNYSIKRIAPSLGGAEFVIFKDMGGNKLAPKNQAYFFEQLSFLLKSGLTLFQSIDIMSQSSNVDVAKLTTQLKPSIVSGLSLDEAMKKTGLFEYDTLAKIEAGRSSGSLTDTLDMLAGKIKKSMELKQKLISSLTYPAFMVVMLVAVLILMLTIIVPSIGETIKQLGGEMPQLTLIIMGASDFLVSFGLYIILGLVAIIGLHIYLMKNVKKYQFMVHTILYKMPIFGQMLMKVHLQTFANTLSQLLSSGVTIANALQISIKTIPNLKMRDAVAKANTRVSQDGYDVYSAFESTGFFPLEFVQMIMIGSHSGNLDGILESISDQYAKDVEEQLKRITALVEPIAILATAAVGGVCVIAMYLPMFSVFESI